MSDNDNQRICELWRNRPTLSEADWHEFYMLVMPLLLRTRLPAQYSDQSVRRELAHTFFAEKILLNAHTSQAGPIIDAKALHEYFKRFTIDSIGAHTEQSDSTDDVALPPALDELQILRDAKLSPEQIANAAEAFVGNLETWEMQFLRRNTCEDADHREPIADLAARLELASYHYKAAALGITRQKGSVFSGYQQTKIGKWLRSLGIELNREWSETILIALKILCYQILERVEN